MDLQSRNIAGELEALLSAIKHRFAVRSRFIENLRKMNKKERMDLLNLLNQVKAVMEDEL